MTVTLWILLADFIFGKECKIVCYSLMTSGKSGVRRPLYFLKLTVPFRSIAVTCRLNVPLVLIWMSKPSLPVISRNISAVIFSPFRNFRLFFVELLMPSGFFLLFFLFFFSFPFQTLFFLPFCIRLTGLYQGSGVKTEGIEYMDRQEGDDFSILRILQDVFNPVLAIGCRFFPVTLLVKDSA